MGLIKKLFGGSEPEDERIKRLKGARDTLKGFLKKVDRKRDKSTVVENIQLYDNQEDTINNAGKICYTLTHNAIPKYGEIAGQATPKNLVRKKERDNLVCETAEAFFDYVDFFLSHQGAEEWEYGIFAGHMPIYPGDQGKYTAQDKLEIFERLKLPQGSDMDNLKNYAVKTACKEIEGNLSSLVGALNHSGIVQEILNTPEQLNALEEFITETGREVIIHATRLEDYQATRNRVYDLESRQIYNGELKERDALRKSLSFINSELGELTKRYEQDKQKLLEMGIDASNIPDSIAEAVAEIGFYKSESGKYKSQKVLEEEREIREKIEKRKQQGLNPTEIYNVKNNPHNKTETIEEWQRKTGYHKRPSTIIRDGDSSALWGDKK